MAQNKISRRSFLRGAGASATIAAASCMAPSAAACDIKSLWSMDLQILATSDTHGKFDPWDYAANKADASGSVAQQATAIKQCRTRNTLVVDAGDTIQANSAELFLNDDLHPMIAAMNAIGYDIWTTGNHEYNYGMDVLKKVMGQQKAKVLTGNVYAPDGTPAGRRLHHHQKGHREDRCHRHGHPQHQPLGCQESGGLEGHQPCGREPQDH